MKNSANWKSKPNFLIDISIDGLQYSSYDKSGFTFNTWDSVFQGFRIIRDVEEEQEKSTITITIIEKKNTHFLGIGDTVKEKIYLIYDYRLLITGKVVKESGIKTLV